MGKILEHIIGSIPHKLTGPSDISINKLTGDSREIEKGDLFVGKVRIHHSPVQVFGALKTPTQFTLLVEYDVR